MMISSKSTTPNLKSTISGLGPITSLDSTNMLETWRDFGLLLMVSPPEARQSSRKLFRDLTLKVPGSFLNPNEGSVTYESTGYKPTKVTQLQWHYLNQPTIDRCLFDVKAKLQGRKVGSGTWDFRGNVKKHVKADYCLVGGVATCWKDAIDLDIFYRSTEFIKRFLGDLIFFKQDIVPQFVRLAPVNSIKFHFSNLTWHPMMAMYLLAHVPDWEDWMARLEKKDYLAYLAIIRHNHRIFGDLDTDQRFNVLRRIQKYIRSKRDDPFMKAFGKWVIKQHKETLK